MRPDEILLLDMLVSARRACEFCRDISKEEFEQDSMRQLAVIKAIEIIGEAADRISEEFQQSHAELPWREIIGMRHHLVHGYFVVDLEKVWGTVHQDLPNLIESLKPLVPPED